MKQVTNNPDLQFKPLTDELYREYIYPIQLSNGELGEYVVRIDNPQALHVSESGGHRIQGQNGEGIYIPAGWVKLSWETKSDYTFQY